MFQNRNEENLVLIQSSCLQGNNQKFINPAVALIFLNLRHSLSTFETL